MKENNDAKSETKETKELYGEVDKWNIFIIISVWQNTERMEKNIYE